MSSTRLSWRSLSAFTAGAAITAFILPDLPAWLGMPLTYLGGQIGEWTWRSSERNHR